MTKRLLTFLLCALLLSQCCAAFAGDYPAPAVMPADAPDITNSQFVLLYEETTDTVLYAINPRGVNPPASMTKVMTALLVLEYDPDLSGKTVVPPEAVSEHYCYWMDYGHLEAGEEITVRDLMEYLLIPSGNEAGTTLAAYVAGDIDTFIKMMNHKAAELGMDKTFYLDPHGLSSNNSISCEDMLILCREAMQYPLFREIVSTKTGELPKSNMRSKAYRYNTTNRVMYPRNVWEYETDFADDIVGIKTGFINQAGLNLACCMEYDEQDLTFYSVVMHADEVLVNGAERSGHYLDTIELMTWARTFHKEGVAAGEQVATAATKGSREDNIVLAAESGVQMLTQNALQRQITLNEIGKEVKAGDMLGTLTLTDDFGNIREIPLLAAADAKTDSTLLYAGIGAVAVVLVAAALVLTKKRKVA